MPKIHINNQEVEVEMGTTVFEAAKKLGIFIPHFCYHKKLSIAANCRMCLVEVEKAPKPLPACATPVNDGMKVFTHSPMALKAQAGVMEFLLINHPLDCPVCDQGGECQLQDLAVGYGKCGSRYNEKKRKVKAKDMGPLISAAEMARCIHCSRCVRFTEELGGFQEIGIIHRNEHAEVSTFIGKTVNSEVSGNVIDLCPVGALTSKPFRYSARNWELSRRKSISMHDSVGTNLIVQVKNNEVKRVLPFENEDLNECWLADRDRFSYEGLNSDQRLLHPMIKNNGVWIDVSWQTALNQVQDLISKEDKKSTAFLASEHSTSEELYLLKLLANQLGVPNVDSRLRQQDFRAELNFTRADQIHKTPKTLGMKISEINDLNSLLLVGSTITKEQPLISIRLRKAKESGLEVNMFSWANVDFRIGFNSKVIVKPSKIIKKLKELLELVKNQSEIDQSKSELKEIARSLINGEKSSILVGNLAKHNPNYSKILSISSQIAKLTNSKFGIIAEASNSVFADTVFRPAPEGKNAQQILDDQMNLYLLLNTEIEFDCNNFKKAKENLKNAKVIALSTFKSDELLEYADVLLPISAFTETAGSFVNMEGRIQHFNGVVKPKADVRPAWKVIRVLGSMLNLSVFDEFNEIDDVRKSAFSTNIIKDNFIESDNNKSIKIQDLQEINDEALENSNEGLERVALVPMYLADYLCRRASALQETVDSKTPCVELNAIDMEKLKLKDGDLVKVKNKNSQSVELKVEMSKFVQQGCAYIVRNHPMTNDLDLNENLFIEFLRSKEENEESDKLSNLPKYLSTYCNVFDYESAGE